MDFANRAEAHKLWLSGADYGDPTKRIRELRALTTTNATSVPTNLEDSLIAERDSTAVVRSVATVIQTESGAPLKVPASDDTANSAAMLAENAERTENSDFVIGSATFGAFTFTARAIMSSELTQDCGPGVQRVFGRLLGARLGRAVNAKLTTGTGSSQPLGICTGAAVAKTAAAEDAITVSELIDLFGALPDSYHAGARFMMQLATLISIIKAEDGEERPLFDVTTGLLLGKPVIINAEMPAMASDSKAVLFGDFSTFGVREMEAIELRRDYETKIDAGQVVLAASTRIDSKYLDAAGVVALRMAGS